MAIIKKVMNDWCVYIVILLIIIFVLMYNRKIIQKFTNDLVAYNSNHISNTLIETDFDIKSDGLEELLKNTNVEKDYNEDISEYNLFNENLDFPYANIFKKIILNYLDTIIKIYKEDNCYISDIFNIHYKDIKDDTRVYLFYVNLVNPVQLFTKSLKIKLSIQNFTKFSNPNIPLDKDALQQNTTILYIIYDNNKTMNIKGVDAYYANVYTLTNRLHLMDPFLTTGKEMTITKNMIDKFKTTLEIKSHAQKMLENNLNKI